MSAPCRNLADAVAWLQRADERELSMKTLLLREPWSAVADVRILLQREDGGVPAEALEAGHSYFLEAAVAREALDTLRHRKPGATLEDACRLLVHYARNDAYPAWSF